MIKEHDPDLIGEFIKEYCPRCGCTLLENKLGNTWCSRPGCTYGLEELMEKYKDKYYFTEIIN